MFPQFIELDTGCDQVSNSELPRGSGVDQPMGVSAEMFTVEHTHQLHQFSQVRRSRLCVYYILVQS